MLFRSEIRIKMTREMVVTSSVNLKNGYLLCPLWISGIGKPVQMKSLDFRSDRNYYMPANLADAMIRLLDGSANEGLATLSQIRRLPRPNPHPVQIVNPACLPARHDGTHGHGAGDCDHCIWHPEPPKRRNYREWPDLGQSWSTLRRRYLKPPSKVP